MLRRVLFAPDRGSFAPNQVNLTECLRIGKKSWDFGKVPYMDAAVKHCTGGVLPPHQP